MKKKNGRINIFGLTTVLAVAFLIFCFGFSLISNMIYANHSKNINNTISQISNKIYADGLQHTLTVLVDDNFNNVQINNEEIDLENYSHNYVENELITISYELNTGFEFADYIAYETGNQQNVVNIQNDSFIMPNHDVTLLIKRKFNIKIYKVFYDNKTSISKSLFENLNLNAGENCDLDFNIDTNYHLYEVNGKYYSSNNNNVSLENTTISITNTQNDDIVEIYFEKNYYSFTIYCGTNEEANNKEGGTFALLSNDNIFSVIPNPTNGTISANIYYGQNISISIINQPSYVFNDIFIYNENHMQEGYSSVTPISSSNEITINNISSKIFIYIQFIRKYNIVVQTEKINIDGESIKIGKSGFADETLSYDDRKRDVIKNGEVSVKTEMNTEFNKVYEFKYWEILDNQQQRIEDLSIFGITQEKLKNNILSLSNIDQELYIKAIYGIKNRTINIAWNGQNGTIESEVEDEDYLFTIKYGEEISFVLKPTDNMRFLKTIELIGKNDNEDENVVEDTITEDGLIYRISNVTENLTLNVQFVVNTWWEHIEKFEFDGKGTKEEPYLIRNASDLALISYNLNNGITQRDGDISFNYAYYLVTTDIDCGEDYYFVPIGTTNNPFNGTFDYAYHTIKNIKTEKDVALYQYDGLFDVIGEYGKIINRYRTYGVLILTIVGSVVFLLVVIRIVLAIEKKRNKPKKVIILKNYQQSKTDENS